MLSKTQISYIFSKKLRLESLPKSKMNLTCFSVQTVTDSSTRFFTSFLTLLMAHTAQNTWTSFRWVFALWVEASSFSKKTVWMRSTSPVCLTLSNSRVCWASISKQKSILTDYFAWPIFSTCGSWRQIRYWLTSLWSKTVLLSTHQTSHRYQWTNALSRFYEQPLATSSTGQPFLISRKLSFTCSVRLCSRRN